jgi:hypothetical protein
VCRKMGTITMVQKLQFSLQLSRGTQGSPHMSAELYNVLDVGLGACMALPQQSTFFTVFCDHICSEIKLFGVPVTDVHCILLWANLAGHHSTYVHQRVTGRAGPRQFTIVARLQYHHKCGPIECKICELTNILHMKKEPTCTMQDLENVIYQTTALIETFDSTFVHCGY